MSNVVKPAPWWIERQPPSTTPPEPPDPPDMQARVTKLEAVAEKTGERLAQIDVRLARIETKFDGHEKLFASKEDLARAEGSMKAAIAEAKSSIIMWVVGSVFFAQLLPSVPTLIKLFFP